MERLAPILKQKFWILLGVAILMTLIGWYMATSAMAKAITDRTAEINQAFEKVPKGAIPNETWAKKLNDLNSSQEKAIALTQAVLWQKQLAKMMSWPDEVEIQNGYWGKFSNESREAFRQAYKSEVAKVWKTLRPLDPDDPEGNGIVQYPFDNMYTVLKKRPWGNINVESNVLWEIKEDLWLLERLFQTIATVNGGPESNRIDAYIHQIDRLELRGGGNKPKAAAAKAPGGVGKIGGGKKNAPDLAVVADQAVAAPTGPLAPLSAEFDPVEELGEDGSSAGGATGGGPPAIGGKPGIGKDAAPKTINRYVLNDPKLPYKTRGFYLSVKMDHTKIPAFIAELTANGKSVLPIEVLRVQMARLHEDNPMAPGATPQAAPQFVAAGGGGGGGFGGGKEERRRQRREDEGGYSRGGMNMNVPAFAAAPGAGKAAGEIPKNAQAGLAKALSDPEMAQVTICGVFMLYQKSSVEAPPEIAPAPASTSTSDQLTQSESTDQPATDGDNQPSESAKDKDEDKDEEMSAEATGDTKDEPDTPPKAEAEEK